MTYLQQLIDTVQKEALAEQAGDDVAHSRLREVAFRLLLAVEKPGETLARMRYSVSAQMVDGEKLFCYWR